MCGSRAFHLRLRLPPRLLVFVFIVYLPAILWGGFVWDDIHHIPGESAISDWGGIIRIWFQPTEVAEPHYRPLTYTSFWLEHKLWGYNPMGYHAVNVLLHGATALLLWRVLGAACGSGGANHRRPLGCTSNTRRIGSMGN